MKEHVYVWRERSHFVAKCLCLLHMYVCMYVCMYVFVWVWICLYLNKWVNEDILLLFVKKNEGKCFLYILPLRNCQYSTHTYTHTLTYVDIIIYVNNFMCVTGCCSFGLLVLLLLLSNICLFNFFLFITLYTGLCI